MPQVAGGGGYRPKPKLTPDAALQAFLESNVFNQPTVSGAGQKMWEDVSSIPGSLWDLLNMVGGEVQGTSQLGGADPLVLADTLADVSEAAAEETLSNIQDPVGYFKEHPGFALMDLLGAAGVGARGISSAARRADMSPGEFLSAEGGAIGPFGRRLETEPPDVVETLFGEMKPSPGGTTASAPNLGLAKYNNPPERGFVVIKPGMLPGEQRIYNQAAGELATAELVKQAGIDFHIPGITEAIAPYARKQGYFDSSPVVATPRPAALIEYIQDATTPGNWHDIPKTHQTLQDLRDITLLDIATGNTDRALGHNLMLDPEGRPFAIDFGLGFSHRGMGTPGGGLAPGDVFAPEIAWGAGNPSLIPNDIEKLQALLKALENPSDKLLQEAGAENIVEAAERVKAVLERNALYGGPRGIAPGYRTAPNGPGDIHSTGKGWRTGKEWEFNESLSSESPSTSLGLDLGVAPAMNEPPSWVTPTGESLPDEAELAARELKRMEFEESIPSSTAQEAHDAVEAALLAKLTQAKLDEVIADAFRQDLDVAGPSATPPDPESLMQMVQEVFGEAPPPASSLSDPGPMPSDAFSTATRMRNMFGPPERVMADANLFLEWLRHPERFSSGQQL